MSPRVFQSRRCVPPDLEPTRTLLERKQNRAHSAWQLLLIRRCSHRLEPWQCHADTGSLENRSSSELPRFFHVEIPIDLAVLSLLAVLWGRVLSSASKISL